MNDHTIGLVKEGFDLVEPIAPRAAALFYENLAEAAPSQEELVYMNSERGFALFSMRSPTITRLYLQCAPNEDLAAWSDARIWDDAAAIAGLLPAR